MPDEHHYGFTRGTAPSMSAAVFLELLAGYAAAHRAGEQCIGACAIEQTLGRHCAARRRFDGIAREGWSSSKSWFRTR
jgi:hypothetical protein